MIVTEASAGQPVGLLHSVHALRRASVSHSRVQGTLQDAIRAGVVARIARSGDSTVTWLQRSTACVPRPAFAIRRDATVVALRG